MAMLTVVKFPSAEGARSVLNTLEDLQKQQLITIHDAAIVQWPADKKKPRTEQLHSMAGAGALSGAFWGMLFGLLFFIPLLGAAIGAAMGGLSGSLVDVGIDDNFIKQVRDQVTPGTSALFVLSSDAVTDRVKDALRGVETGAAVIARDAKTAPAGPGVHRMFDADGEVLYVGKARHLKKRVQSYARGSGHNNRIARMIADTASMEFVTTKTEIEALLLEANLIKEYRPRFNIALRDDKSYPYIRVTVQEPFPRVYVTRRLVNDGARYFGPYTDVAAMRRAFNALKNGRPGPVMVEVPADLMTADFEGAVDYTPIRATRSAGDARDIDDAVKLARANNPAFQKTLNDVEVAEADVRQRWGGFLPSVSADLRFSGFNSSRLTGEDDYGQPVPGEAPPKARAPEVRFPYLSGCHWCSRSG